MAVIDTKLVPVLIEKLQTELDEIKVGSNHVSVVFYYSAIARVLLYCVLCLFLCLSRID